MVKKELDFVFPYGKASYNVHVTYKKMRRVVFRVKDGVIVISSPFRLPHNVLTNHLTAMMPRLEKMLNREPPQNDQYVYLLGEKKTLVLSAKAFQVTEQEVYAKDPENLDKNLRKWGKSYLTDRVRYYEHLMGIQKPYAVMLRTMETRYGSNSRGTHRLTFATKLLHYSPAIIDAIVVHELAHYFHFDHSAKFYQVIHSYYPTYRQEHLKLRKGMYQ